MKDFFDRLQKLKEIVDNAIAKYLEDDQGHKSYEGSWDISFSMPNYFVDDNNIPDFVKIDLHCYILCPYRHVSWSGENYKEVLDKAKKDIQGWVQEQCLY